MTSFDRMPTIRQCCGLETRIRVSRTYSLPMFWGSRREDCCDSLDLPHICEGRRSCCSSLDVARPPPSVPLFAISSCGWPSNLHQNRERKRGKEEWNRDRLSAPRHPEVRSCQMMRVYFEITAVTFNNFGDFISGKPNLAHNTGS